MQNRTAYDPYAWQPRGPRRRVGTALATALCAACLSLAGLMLLPGLLGYQRYVIFGFLALWVVAAYVVGRALAGIWSELATTTRSVG